MAYEEEKGTIEELWTALEKPGSSLRTVLKALLGDRELRDPSELASQLKEIWAGERQLTARDFRMDLAKNYDAVDDVQKFLGIDSKEFPTDSTGVVKNFLADILVDVVTSPDGIFKAPGAIANLIKARKTLPVLGEVGGKELSRGLTGAMLGAMSYDADYDSAEDVALKTLTGFSVGMGLGPLGKGFKKASKFAGDVAFINKLKITDPEAIKQADKTLEMWFKRSQTDSNWAINFGNWKQDWAGKKAPKFGYDIGVDDLRDTLRNSGHKIKSIQRIYDANAQEFYRRNLLPGDLYDKFHDQMADLFTKSTAFRKQQIPKWEEFYLNNQDMSKVHPSLKTPKGLPKKYFIERQALARATTLTNDHVGKYILSKQAEMDPEIFTAIKDYVKMNNKNMKAYNRYMDEIEKENLLRADPGLSTEALNKKFKERRKLGIRSRDKDTPGYSTVSPFFKYHTLDLANFDEFDDALKDLNPRMLAIRAGARKRMREDLVKTNPDLKREEMIFLAAKNYAKMFMSKEELFARTMLARFNKKPDEEMIQKAIKDPSLRMNIISKNIAKIHDATLGHMKTLQLLFSGTWIANNLPENISKAFIIAKDEKLGLAARTRLISEVAASQTRYLGQAAIDPIKSALSKGAPVIRKEDAKLLKGIDFNEIQNAFDPIGGVTKISFKDDWAQVGFETGVFDTAKIQEYLADPDLSKNLAEVLVSPKQRAAKQKMLETSKFLKKANEAGSFFEDTLKLKNFKEFLKNTVGTNGTMMEASARMLTFKALNKSWLKQPENKWAQKLYKEEGPKIFFGVPTEKILKKVPEDKINKLIMTAKKHSRIVNDAFFDYTDVSTFEMMVMKRIFPYWPFFSKSMGFWLKGLVDPNSLSSAAPIWRSPTALGKEPTKEQRKMMPEFQLEKGARFIGKDKNGDWLFSSWSAFVPAEMLQAIDDVLSREPGKPLSKYVSPLIKEPVEQVFSRDFFRDEPLLPRQIKDVKGRSQRMLYTKRISPSIETELLGMGEKDKYKRRILRADGAKSEAAMRLKRLRQTLLPANIIDSVLRKQAAEEIGSRKPEDLLPTAVGAVTPFRTMRLTPGLREWAKKQAREKDKEMRKRKAKKLRDKRR